MEGGGRRVGGGGLRVEGCRACRRRATFPVRSHLRKVEGLLAEDAPPPPSADHLSRGGRIKWRSRKVDMRLPGKEDSNFHGARPAHQRISMIT